ncbi:MAG: signal peptidase I [Desulfobulbaceae bacterium]|uniref:Signal peptidase I n=1 Tax=Candidatus Desulfatifera sulfidica TaxID=2841691 RepID=A0A8J6N8Y6_9BACT|nr:signal peptidase I [Candidatus Desulfatifera sulfidica]
MAAKQKKNTVREYTEAIVIAVLLAVVIRTFVVQAFKIPSGSMLPTLQIGDHLLVSKFVYGLRLPATGTRLIPWKDPARGDVVVFRFPENRSIDYIKRVVGVAGDRVEIRNKQLFINGKRVEDSHAHFTNSPVMPASVGPRDNFGPVLVPQGNIFVMGDNRDNSYDGRFWGFVEERDILGKAFVLYWSWDIDRPLFSLDRLQSIRWTRLGDWIY